MALSFPCLIQYFHLFLCILGHNFKWDTIFLSSPLSEVGKNSILLETFIEELSARETRRLGGIGSWKKHFLRDCFVAKNGGFPRVHPRIEIAGASVGP